MDEPNQAAAQHSPGQQARAGIERHSRRDSSRAGFGLIEVMISLSILTIALLAFAQAILLSMRAGQAQREQGIARDAARQIIERMQAETFSEVFARFNATADDDPLGGTVFVGGFPVNGLQARANDADGFVGEISFPSAPGMGGGLELRENVDDARFGTPRDLNADGVVDALDHSGDYRLLPVAVRLEWRGSAGNANLEFRTYLADIQ